MFSFLRLQNFLKSAMNNNFFIFYNFTMQNDISCTQATVPSLKIMIFNVSAYSGHLMQNASLAGCVGSKNVFFLLLAPSCR